MRIIQVTDLHIGKKDEDTYGVDVRNNFLAIVSELQKYRPDCLVVSGDLCFNVGEPEVYTWVKEELEKMETPFHIIGGNHDDVSMIQQIFGQAPSVSREERYYSSDWASYKTLFLDTSSGSISEAQMKWIKQQVEETDKKLLVFLHHPPVKAGVPYMDTNYSLREMEKLQSVFFNHSAEVYAFCGHYHVDRMIFKNNLTTFITPSCFFQINPHFEQFKVDHYNIGFRIIDLRNGQLFSSVRYL